MTAIFIVQATIARARLWYRRGRAYRQYSATLQISFSGLTVPPLPQLAEIPAGLSVLNSPDTDFASPPRFPLLTSVENGINIAGCNSKHLYVVFYMVKQPF